jgi:hypothetical protein
MATERELESNSSTNSPETKQIDALQEYLTASDMANSGTETGLLPQEFITAPPQEIKRSITRDEYIKRLTPEERDFFLGTIPRIVVPARPEGVAITQDPEFTAFAERKEKPKPAELPNVYGDSDKATAILQELLNQSVGVKKERPATLMPAYAASRTAPQPKREKVRRFSETPEGRKLVYGDSFSGHLEGILRSMHIDRKREQLTKTVQTVFQSVCVFASEKGEALASKINEIALGSMIPVESKPVTLITTPQITILDRILNSPSRIQEQLGTFRNEKVRPALTQLHEYAVRLNEWRAEKLASPEVREFFKRARTGSIASLIGLHAFHFGGRLLEATQTVPDKLSVMIPTFVVGYLMANNIFKTGIYKTQEQLASYGKQIAHLISAASVLAAVAMPFLSDTVYQPQQPLYGNRPEISLHEDQEEVLLNQAYQHLYNNPKEVLPAVVRGYAIVDGKKVPVDLSALNLVSGEQTPVKFIDEGSGDLIATLHKAMWYGDDTFDLKKDQTELLQAVEGPSYGKAELGVSELLFNITKRYFDGKYSGGSDESMQAIAMLLLGQKLDSAIITDGPNTSFLLDPQNYDEESLARLTLALSRGQIPTELTEFFYGDELPDENILRTIDPRRGVVVSPDPDKVKMLNQQLIRFAAAQAILDKYGNDAVIKHWFNNVPLGRAKDTNLAIIGGPALGAYLWGEPDPSKWNTAQWLMVVRAINQPNHYLSDLENTLNEYTKRHPGATEFTLMDVNLVEGAITGWYDDEGKFQPGVIDNVINKQHALTEANRLQVLEELKTLKWTLKTPDKFKNQILALNSAINAEVRARMEHIFNPSSTRFALPDLEGKSGEDASGISGDAQLVELTPDGAIISINFPYTGETINRYEAVEALRDVERGNLLEEKMEAFLAEHLEEKIIYVDGKKKVFYEYNRGKGWRSTGIASFRENPGLGVAMVIIDKNGQRTVVNYDGTEGFVDEQPMQYGSLIEKIAMTAFFYNEGWFNNLATDMVDVREGPYRTDINNGINVRNATRVAVGQMTAEEALVRSNNAFLQHILQQYLYEGLEYDEGFEVDPEHINFLGDETQNLKAKAEVQRRWMVIQNFHKNIMGYVLTDQDGTELVMPPDVPLLGTNVFAKSATPGVQTLVSFADVFARVASPEKFPQIASKPRLLQAFYQISSALKRDDIRKMAFAKTSYLNMIHVLADGTLVVSKGGTVDQSRRDLLGSTIATLSGMGGERADGTTYAMVAMQLGEEETGEFDRDGNPMYRQTNLDLFKNQVYRATGKRYVESESGALFAVSRHLLENMMQIEVDQHDDSVAKDINAVLARQPTERIQPRILGSDTTVLNSAGQEVKVLPTHSIVDFVGENIDGYNRISWIEDGKLLTGRIVGGTASYPNNYVIDNLKERDAELIQKADQILNLNLEDLGIDEEIDLSDRNIIIVDDKESSPVLRALHEILETTDVIGLGPDTLASKLKEFNLPEDTIVLSRSRLNSALRDFSAQTDTFNEVAKEMNIDPLSYPSENLGGLVQEELDTLIPSRQLASRTFLNLLRQQTVQNNLSINPEKTLSLDVISYDANGKITVAGAFLKALGDYNIFSDARNKGGLIDALEIPYDPESPRSQSTGRLREIAKLYNEVLTIKNPNQLRTRVQRLENLLYGLNTNTTDKEKRFLGIPMDEEINQTASLRRVEATQVNGVPQ